MLSLAIKAVQAPKDEILRIYRQSFQVKHKEDGSPVTIADETSDQLITQILKAHSPYPVLSEESYNPSSWTLESKNNVYWLLDPLDGTKEFIAKTGEFCICLALIKNSQPILGVIYNPLTQETFYAEKNLGAYVWPQGGSPLRLYVDRVFDPSPPLNILLSRRTSETLLKKVETQFPQSKVSFMGSALKFCSMVKGFGDISFRLSQTALWDLASGHILMEEAKGSFTRWDQTPLVYHPTEIYEPSFLAATPKGLCFLERKC